MGVVNFATANAMLIGIVNLDSQRRFASGVIDAEKASPDQIQEGLLLADSQVVLADVDNPYHYRNLAPSADLSHGDSVPGGVMRPCSVVIKVASTDTTYVGGVRGRWGWDQIERWRRNHNNIYGPYRHDDENSPMGAKFCFKGNKIGFLGTAARVIRAPEFEIDRDTPACQADEIYTALVVSGGVFYLYQEGYVSDALFSKHEAVWTRGIEKLNQRAIAILGNTEE